jgi:protein TonB
MMTMDRNPNAYSLALAIEGRSKRWSPTMIVGVVLSVALHIVLLIALFQAQFGGRAAKVETDDPPTIVTLAPLTPPKPTPNVKTPPPAPIHKTPPLQQPTDKTPFVPPPHQTLTDEHAEPPVTETPAKTTATAEPTPVPSKVITDPTWISRPSADEMARFYPPAALDRNLGGVAVLNCMVGAGGKPLACIVTSETPPGHGFGAAAVKLSAFFKMKPRTENGQDVDGGVVRIAIRFDPGLEA